MFFSQWMRSGNPDDLCVCEIYARDRDVFKDRLQKVHNIPSLTHPRFDICVHSQIWLHPNPEYLTNNIHETDAAIAQTQVTRDQYILKTFKVGKPYILFSRHHYMQEMDEAAYGVTINSEQRFNEMVVYPQIQDALMFGVELSLPQAKKVAGTGKLKTLHWEKEVNNWKIVVPQSTVDDCTKHNETYFFN